VNTVPPASTGATPWGERLLPVLAAVGLAYVFWQPLWWGAGLVGGDLYSYYFPQKQFLADALRSGTFPLWNHLAGHGYPVLGESQTGACYPLHVLLYRWCDVQTAWNAVLVLHYAAAFLLMWCCARRSGLAVGGSLLAATVYVYGWFPVRSCLEWAILGGLYLPAAVWCVEGFLQTGRSRYLGGLGAALGLQLLGGHYQMAFYTWLLLGGYVPSRVFWVEWVETEPPAGNGKIGGEKIGGEKIGGEKIGGEKIGGGKTEGSPGMPCAARSKQRGLRFGCLVAAMAGGVALGSVQLFPTAELQRLSQRGGSGPAHDPNYGAIPPAYLSQLIAPWYWYDPSRDLDAELNRLRWGALPSGTNRVEAHLYFGQVPFYLVVVGLMALAAYRRIDRWTFLWLMVVTLATVIAVGWLQAWLVSMPGFRYFRGVGRVGVLVTLGWALLAGRMLDLATTTWRPFGRFLGVAGVWGLTVIDLAWWPAPVNYAVMVENVPIRARDASPLREILRAEPQQPVRLYAPGANIANLLGVASTPVYLGLGPRAYFDPQYTLPAADEDDFHAYSAERVAWLKQAGVTHVLSFEPLERRGWPVEFVWSGWDPLLNPAWARFTEPLYLYRLRGAPGRVTWATGETEGIGKVKAAVDRVTVEVAAAQPGTLVLKDLDYPGWQVAVDGANVSGMSVGMFRGVNVPAGKHTVVWSYRPASVYWGAVGSALGAGWLGLAAWLWRAWLGARALESTARSG